MAEVKKKTIADAIEEADEYVAGELVGVFKEMVGIVKNSEDDRARVSAASKIIDYARPPKGGPLVNVNLPTVVSALGLPPGADKSIPVTAIDGPKEPPKILPEPNPLQQTRFGGHFDAAHPVQPAAPAFARPEPLTPKASTPHAPDQPPLASSIRPIEP